MKRYKIEAATGQHPGDRDEQQDRVSLFAAPKAPGYVMAVIADGMGGMSGGALAADQVIRSARQAFESFSPLTDDVEHMLATIVRDAHTILTLTALASEKRPHSTIVLLVLTPEREAVWTHVGDSRLYRFRGPNCVDRTTDHSYVEKLIEQGKLARDAAHGHRMSNVLMSALGMSAEEPEAAVHRCHGLRADDAFLLCTDGLWHYFSDAELGAAIAVNSPRKASEMLINKARERAIGLSADNCTLAIIKLIAAPDEAKSRSGGTGRTGPVSG
jgi:serine/threonine protein phosphatase PrpC